MAQCRILLVWPPKVEYVFSIQKHFTYFGETAAFLGREPDVEVTVLDGTALQHFAWAFIEAYASKFDFVLVYTDLHNSLQAIRAAQECKRISPDSQVVSFGEGTAFAPRTYVEHGFDAAIVDAMYERSALSYIRWRRGDLAVDGLHGVVYADKGVVQECPPRLPMTIDDIAFPALDLLPVARYVEISGRNQLCFTVARGCPYRCPFCRVPVAQAGGVAYRDAEAVLDYMEQQRARWNSMKLIAPTFTADREWVLDFCSRAAARQSVGKWIVTTRLERLDQELLRAMAQAGCIAIAFGLETLDVRTQERIGKHVTEDELRSQVALIHDAGIIPKAFIMLGIPGQTRSEVEATFAKLRELRVEIRPKEYYPYEAFSAAADPMALFERFDRQGVYRSPMLGVTAAEFVSWLRDRTSVR